MAPFTDMKSLYPTKTWNERVEEEMARLPRTVIPESRAEKRRQAERNLDRLDRGRPRGYSR